jgi:hypothetical protein
MPFLQRGGFSMRGFGVSSFFFLFDASGSDVDLDPPLEPPNIFA